MYSANKLHWTLLMTNINPCFKTKKVLTYVADLIIDYDYNHFSDLSITDKEHLASLLIEAAGSDGEAECLLESNNLDLIIATLKNVLANNSQQNSEAVVEILKESAVEYYEKIMAAIFYHVNENYRAERNEWLDKACKEHDEYEALDLYMARLC